MRLCRSRGRTQVSCLPGSSRQSPGNNGFAGAGCAKGPRGWWGTYGPDSTLMERILRKLRSMMLGHSMRNSQRLPWKLSSSHTVILYCPRVSMASLLVMRVAWLLAEPYTSPRAGAHHQPPATPPAWGAGGAALTHPVPPAPRPPRLAQGMLPIPLPLVLGDLCPMTPKLPGALAMFHLSM